MTMPGARKITVEDRTYPYKLKADKHRLEGWTSREIRLIVEFRPGKFVSQRFESKLWTADHEDNADIAPAHKASFTPADVRSVITTLEFNQGKLPATFETGVWKCLEA